MCIYIMLYDQYNLRCLVTLRVPYLFWCVNSKFLVKKEIYNRKRVYVCTLFTPLTFYTFLVPGVLMYIKMYIYIKIYIYFGKIVSCVRDPGRSRPPSTGDSTDPVFNHLFSHLLPFGGGVL